MLEKIPVCISSVYQRETEFKYLRSIAKEVIEKHAFLVGIRNPEDVKTQVQFDHYLSYSLALVVILGNMPSDAVAKEVHLALTTGIPVIPLIKTTIEDNRIQAPIAARNLLDQAAWNFEDTKIYFNDADEFRTILDQLISYSLIRRLETSADIYQNRMDVYERMAETLEKCRQLCVLAQKTPTIFLGPKAGDQRDRKFYDVTLNVLHRIQEGKLKHLLMIFSDTETREAFNDGVKYPNVEEAKRNLFPLLTAIEEQVVIRATDDSLSPFLITDYNFIYKLHLGTAQRYMILPSVILRANQIKDLLGACETMGRHVSIEDLRRLFPA
jgi:hypothetical protein